MKKCIAYITYEDGSASIQKLKLDTGVSFGLSEMRRWIKEQDPKPVKKIKFLSKKKADSLVGIARGLVK